VPWGARTGKIVLEPAAPLHAVTSTFDFLILQDPDVTGFGPLPAHRGSKLTIQGTGFGQWDKMSARFVCTDPNYTLPQDCLEAAGTNKTDKSFDVVVPLAARTGVVQVLASTPAGDTGFRQSTMALTIDVPLQVTGLDHDREMRGRNVTAFGSGFLNDPAFLV